MGTAKQDIYEQLKLNLYQDDAVTGEAAGIAMGLVMLGTKSAMAIEDMVAVSIDWFVSESVTRMQFHGSGNAQHEHPSCVHVTNCFRLVFYSSVVKYYFYKCTKVKLSGNISWTHLIPQQFISAWYTLSILYSDSKCDKGGLNATQCLFLTQIVHFQYAQETQHEKILRGLAVGIALTMYGRLEEADTLIESLCRDKDPILRWSGMAFPHYVWHNGTTDFLVWVATGFTYKLGNLSCWLWAPRKKPWILPNWPQNIWSDSLTLTNDYLEFLGFFFTVWHLKSFSRCILEIMIIYMYSIALQ